MAADLHAVTVNHIFSRRLPALLVRQHFSEIVREPGMVFEDDALFCKGRRSLGNPPLAQFAGAADRLNPLA